MRLFFNLVKVLLNLDFIQEKLPYYDSILIVVEKGEKLLTAGSAIDTVIDTLSTRRTQRKNLSKVKEEMLSWFSRNRMGGCKTYNGKYLKDVLEYKVKERYEWKVKKNVIVDIIRTGFNIAKPEIANKIREVAESNKDRIVEMFPAEGTLSEIVVTFYINIFTN